MMFDKMRGLMEMKKKAEELKRELDSAEIEVDDVRGIKIVISGSQNFQSVEIAAELLSPENQKRLENDLLRALNSAIKKSQNLAAQKMQAMTGFNIPGLN